MVPHSICTESVADCYTFTVYFVKFMKMPPSCIVCSTKESQNLNQLIHQKQSCTNKSNQV